MSEIKLKPCPFCGSPAELNEGKAGWWVQCSYHPLKTQEQNYCGILPCTAYTDCDTPEEAIELWNKRQYENNYGKQEIIVKPKYSVGQRVVDKETGLEKEIDSIEVCISKDDITYFYCIDEWEYPLWSFEEKFTIKKGN